MPSRHPTLRIRGNGRLRSISTTAGRGALFHEWISLSRWQEATPAACGPFIYLSEAGRWTEHANSKALDLESALSIEIHPALDLEIRRLTLRDLSGRDRHLQVSFATEVALHHPMGDAGHPAFAKLFIQTESPSRCHALLARRRPRGHNEQWPWYGQSLVGDISSLSWQTNRVSCIGRGRAWHDPAFMDSTHPLSGEIGNVLDPVFCWRGETRIPARGEVHIYLLSGCAREREACIDLLEQSCPEALASLFHEAVSARREKEKASGLPDAELDRCDGFIAALLGADPALKAPTPLTPEGSDAVHFRAPGPEQSRIVFTGAWESGGGRWLRGALPYWRSLGLDPRVLVMGQVSEPLPEGFESIGEERFSPAALAWLAASAQLTVGDDVPSLPEACSEILPVPETPAIPDVPLAGGKNLAHWNGHGGFTETNEYTVVQPLENGRLKRPPMPWINVLANQRFGCLVSESGAGYTWARNSQANRISPWSNDPVRDPHGEALYLRDPATGEIWSPLPGPCRARVPFLVTHGHGTTRFVSERAGLKMDTTFVVPPDDPVKLVVLRLENADDRDRDVDLAHWIDLVMASQMERHHTTLAWTGDDGISRAINPRAGDFYGGIAFALASVNGRIVKDTAVMHSRASMFGPLLDRGAPRCWGGTASRPARGFGRDAGFGRVFGVRLEAGGATEIVFVLGEAMSEGELSALAEKYLRPQAAAETIHRTLEFW